MEANHNDTRQFTVPQMQALRTLYGRAVQLTNNASTVVERGPRQNKYVVSADDLDKLKEAIGQVRSKMLAQK